MDHDDKGSTSLSGRGKVVGILAQKLSVMPPEDVVPRERSAFAMDFENQQLPLDSYRPRAESHKTIAGIFDPSNRYL